MLYRIALPKLSMEITQLPILNCKGFCTIYGEVKQICEIVAEEEYITYIRLAMIFAENELVPSR